MAEWSIAHAWKACKPHGFMGSNPIPSTTYSSHYISLIFLRYCYSDFPLQDYRFKLIEKTKWDYLDDKGNKIPCTKFVYNVINGREILDENRSGPVD